MRIGQNSQKKIKKMKTAFSSGFHFFLSIFVCFDQLSVFVLFGGFVISKQVFNDFKRFGTVLVKKWLFLSKRFVLLFGHENSFQAVFIVL